MPDTKLTFSYTPRHADMLELARHAARHLIPWRRRYAIWLYLAPVIIVGATMLNLFYRETTQAVIAQYVGTILAPWVPLIAFFLVLRFGFRHIERRARSSCTDWLEAQAGLRRLHFSAGEDSLEWSSETSGSWLSYDGIQQLFLTDKAVAIVHAGTVSHVPREAIGDDTATGSFLHFVLDRLEPDARTKSLDDPALAKLVAD